MKQAFLLGSIALAALALAWFPRWWTSLARHPSLLFTRPWSRGANPGVNISQAINIWIIQIVVAIGPPLGALIFSIYIKTDWGISLFFLTPLALIAIPSLRLQSRLRSPRPGGLCHWRTDPRRGAMGTRARRIRARLG